MTDININVVATELDPTKKYLVEVRRGDLPLDSVIELGKVMREQLGVEGFMVISETGQAINVKEIPEARQ